MPDPPRAIFWSFPRPDHLAIGICAQADAGATAGALPHEDERDGSMHGHCARRAAVGTLFSWPIHVALAIAREFGALEAGGPGWLLTGDAAGLVDPITREGIFFPLLSGQLAADAL